ncbi:hypothetical protein C0J52_24701 [Blattella germanica]|nr:hypothetical protein C0J52_24701 [Blattella germanica]
MCNESSAQQVCIKIFNKFIDIYFRQEINQCESWKVIYFRQEINQCESWKVVVIIQFNTFYYTFEH